MQFIYHLHSGQEHLFVEGEVYNYTFKVRRHKRGEEIAFRNLQDGFLYFYKIEEISRREARLTLVHKKYKEVLPKRFFHLLWCVIDPKTIEKTLPMLNELGVSKISFIYCARSQKNFKLRLEKLQKILINSCQQCGRSRLMELEVIKNIDEVMQKYDNIVLIDFCQEKLTLHNIDTIQRVLIGPEGGLEQEERKRFTKVLGLDTSMILRSESAAVSVSVINLLKGW